MESVVVAVFFYYFYHFYQLSEPQIIEFQRIAIVRHSHHLMFYMNVVVHEGN